MNEGIYVVLKLKGLRMPRVLNLYLFGICNIIYKQWLYTHQQYTLCYVPTNTLFYTSSATREYQPH